MARRKESVFEFFFLFFEGDIMMMMYIGFTALVLLLPRLGVIFSRIRIHRIERR